MDFGFESHSRHKGFLSLFLCYFGIITQKVLHFVYAVKKTSNVKQVLIPVCKSGSVVNMKLHIAYVCIKGEGKVIPVLN
jgi:Na+/citrate or Na+/malate symporter